MSEKTDCRIRRKTGSRGFSLVEVMAAIVIVMVGLISTFCLVGLGTTVNTDSKNMMQAYQACQQEVEVLRNMPFGSLQNIVKSSTSSGTLESRFITPTGSDDASRPGDTGYPGLVANLANLRSGSGGLIISNDATNGNLVKHVTVVVRWRDAGNVARSAMMGTIIAKGGIGAR